MKLACESKQDSAMHHVYLDMKLNGTVRTFLLDSGCDITLLPAHFVRGYAIQETNKVIYAANGAPITLLGEVQVDLQLQSLTIPTTALVSEFIAEGMIGYDWLSHNTYYLGLKAM